MMNENLKLIIPIVNKMFGENYSLNAEVRFEQNEHFFTADDGTQEKRIADSNFTIMENPDKHYHLECQSTDDNTMSIRMVEYDMHIALKHSSMKEGILTIRFPDSGILYLRSNDRTPDSLKVRIITRGGEVSYETPILKVQEFSSKQILDENLLFLIPFYLFHYEKELPKIQEDPAMLDAFIDDFSNIKKQLDKMESNKTLDTYTKKTITTMSVKIAESLTKKYPAVREGVEKIMRGQILEYEARTIRNQALAEGRAEEREKLEKEQEEKRNASIIKLIKTNLISNRDIADAMGVDIVLVEKLGKELQAEQKKEAKNEFSPFGDAFCPKFDPDLELTKNSNTAPINSKSHDADQDLEP